MTGLRWLYRLAVAATAIAIVGVGVVELAALVPAWPFGLLEHFRVQYAVAALAITGCSAGFRMRGWFDAAAIATLLHLLVLAPDLERGRRPMPGAGVAVRVLVLNVHTESASFAQVRALIDELRPDVVGLVEVDERWIAGVAPALASYAGRLEQPRADNFGVALYTRAPITGGIEYLDAEVPSAVGSVVIGGAALAIVLTHPLPPVSASSEQEQARELDAIAVRARELAAPLIVMGDLNATPWSRAFHRLVSASGLCDSRAGFGVQASFPVMMPAMRIPLDHLLASCSIGIADRRVERDVGSDHLPVVVELVVPTSPPRR
ncbi:MAG: endonuclease/exonuclease/phosphatase family protein [Kofleriaceae bacterium]